MESQRAAMAAACAGDLDLVDQFAAQLPLGRIGVPDDVARVVLFAVSGLAAFMTGSTLVVDAGDLIR
ncbi:MAG: SDR family oxidoreductase [Mycobacteriales bacterium]